MSVWTSEDEGLLRAYNIRNYLRTSDRLQSISDRSSPLRLQPGEVYFANMPSYLQAWQKYMSAPDNFTYFRLRTKWAKDPLGAPFIFIFLLPFNLISRFISYQNAKQVEMRWETVATGSVVITDRALVQGSEHRQFRMPWQEISALSISNSPPGVNITWRNQPYLLVTPAEDRLPVFLISRYMTIGDRGEELKVSEEFLARARSLGKLRG